MGKLSLKRVVLDILKPLEPSLIEFAKIVGKCKGIKQVNLVVSEMDRKTETIKAVIIGNGINFEKLRKTIEEAGGVIHSIDEVLIER